MKLIARMIRGFFRLIVFRLVPLILILGIAWSGYQVAQAVSRQFDERSNYESRADTFSGTVTAMSPMVVHVAQVVSTPEDAILPTEIVEATEVVDVEFTSTTVPEETTQVEITDEVVVEPTDIPPSLTTEPTETPVPPSATHTPIPTDEPSQTPVPPTATQMPTEESTEAVSRLQIFITNTRIPVVFATNTPQGAESETGDGQPTEVVATTIPLSTNTPPPSATPASTMTFTSEPTALATATETPTPVEPTSAATLPPVPTVFFASDPPEGAVSRGTAVPTVVPLVARDYDLVNIILLGGDDGLTGDDFNRTDTMIIVSINRDTGTVSMLSLPRDLFVYLPSGTMERLNVAYAVGENIGWTDGGFGLLRQTILYNFGINVHYYARIDFGGFREIIDSVDGVNIAVDCDYQDYALIGAEVPEDAYVADDEGLYTLPVGFYEMSGGEALWFARTRGNSSDFDRGRRQQQLIRAIWRKVIANGELNLLNLPNLWSQATSVVETSLTLDVIASLLPIALNVDVSDVENFVIIRTYHTTPWQPPDGSFVQLPIYDTLRPLLEDFYQPPPASQLELSGSSIAVYNGSGNEDWDLVAADSLGWEGFNAIAFGLPEDDTTIQDTVLIDRAGQQRGSRLSDIARALNVRAENIIVDPDPNRVADFEVILGSNYNSCPGGVLPVEATPEAEG
ncbi:MAG: LCP family protein [Aggregatilineales bacterium]